MYKKSTSIDCVLVGGAATTLGIAGLFMSADFDVVAAEDAAFASAMIDARFVADGGIGHLAGGYYRPDIPHYAVEQVSGSLFDGLVDRRRLVRLILGKDSEIVVPQPKT